MSKKQRLRVHGTVTAIEPEVGGAAIVQMQIDSHQDRGERVAHLEESLKISFFYPNYSPSFITTKDQLWVSLELFGSWRDVSIVSAKQTWIKPLSQSPNKFEYALLGELFQWPMGKSSQSFYIDVGFPMQLTLGSLNQALQLNIHPESGTLIHLSKGRIYGEPESIDRETQSFN